MHEPLPMIPLMREGNFEGGDGGGVEKVRDSTGKSDRVNERLLIPDYETRE